MSIRTDLDTVQCDCIQSMNLDRPIKNGSIFKINFYYKIKENAHRLTASPVPEDTSNNKNTLKYVQSMFKK
jgi:hypothetical protein